MSESCAVEVYENQFFNRLKGWLPHPETPFVMRPDFAPCKPLDEITVPSTEWNWSSNWKIIKMPGVTDGDGWEYASRFARFKKQGRAPKTEARVWTKARRRLWTRIMRREALVKNVDIPKITLKVQQGLSSIHAARLKIEEIMRQAPEAADTDQMRSLVTSVNRNIVEILTVIDSAEKQLQTNQVQEQKDERNKASSFFSSSNGNSGKNGNDQQPPLTLANTPAVLKKLKNDVLKEQLAIERALDPSLTAMNEQMMGTPSKNSPINGTPSRSAPIPLKRELRTSSFSNASGSVSSSYRDSNSNNQFRERPSFKASFDRNAHTRPAKSDSITGPNDRRYMGADNGVNNGSNDDLNGLTKIVGSNKKTPEVKSGSAGAFNPALFVNNTSSNSIRINENDEIEDGVFVDRSTQDMIISSVSIVRRFFSLFHICIFTLEINTN
jgi:hypothetical protein